MKLKQTLLILACLFLSVLSIGQPRQRSNWLSEKQEHISRWRLGVGANIGEPTGASLHLYKLSGICKKTINIRKKMSVDLSVSKEGLMLPNLIEKQNSSQWESGGYRAGLDIKLHAPIALNPYIGLGAELGTRNFNGQVAFHPDIVGRVGVEQKIIGLRTSTQSMLHASLLMEAKYNYCLTANHKLLLPSLGIRLHFL